MLLSNHTYANHDYYISAVITLRNLSSHTVVLHSCTAHENSNETVNRCYLSALQGEQIKPHKTIILGKACNKNEPATGYFRLYYAPAGQHAGCHGLADIKYEFPVDPCAPNHHPSFILWSVWPSSQAWMEMKLGSNILEKPIKNRISSACGVTKQSYHSKLGMKKKTKFHYECYLTFVNSTANTPYLENMETFHPENTDCIKPPPALPLDTPDKPCNDHPNNDNPDDVHNYRPPPPAPQETRL